MYFSTPPTTASRQLSSASNVPFPLETRQVIFTFCCFLGVIDAISCVAEPTQHTSRIAFYTHPVLEYVRVGSSNPLSPKELRHDRRPENIRTAYYSSREVFSVGNVGYVRYLLGLRDAPCQRIDVSLARVLPCPVDSLALLPVTVVGLENHR